MSRAEKRKMRYQQRKHASTIAAKMARCSYDYLGSGVPVRITSEIAIQALTRAYKAFLHNNCSVHIERLSYDESITFPRNRAMPEGACSVLAVSQDPKGHLAYGLGYCDKKFLTEAQRYQAAKIYAIGEVSAIVEYSGFPIDATFGSH